MESLDYYLSIRANPYAEDNSVTQEEIDERSYIQFKFDSIVKMIGTEESKRNIDLFYDELMEELDQDQKANLYQQCMERLIDFYELEILEDNQRDRLPSFDITKELKEILYFFEKNKWVEYMTKYLPMDNPQLVYNENAYRDFLALHFSMFVKNMMKDREELPFLIRKYFLLVSKMDAVNTLMKLVKRSKNELVTEYYLKTEGV